MALFDQYAWDGTVNSCPRLTPAQEALVRAAVPGGAGVVAVPAESGGGTGAAFPLFVRVAGRAGERTVLLRVDRFPPAASKPRPPSSPSWAAWGCRCPGCSRGRRPTRRTPTRGPVSVLSVLDGTDLQRLERGGAAGGAGAARRGPVRRRGPPPRGDGGGAVHGRGAPRGLAGGAELEAMQRHRRAVAGDGRVRRGPRAPDAGRRQQPGRWSSPTATTTRPTSSPPADTSPTIVDFALARFEDPYYGFAEYLDVRPAPVPPGRRDRAPPGGARGDRRAAGAYGWRSAASGRSGGRSR